MCTIVFPENHSPVEDAEALRKACKGIGTDEKAIISILGRRNWIQRKKIREAYHDLYQEDLIKRLESELSGNFERAVYRWILDPEDRDAVLLNVALTKKPMDYRVICEVACIQSPEELLATKRAYQNRYKSSLEEDLAQHAKGDMRKFLVGMLSSYRYKGDEINGKVADSEANILHNAIAHKAFNDDEVIRIITTRSKSQIVATLNRYRDSHGTSITKHLKDGPTSDFSTALSIAIQCFTDHHKYFEKIIRHAIFESGIDEETITRVVVTRAEKDLKQIKELYFKRNSMQLSSAVAGVTGGDYKNFILILVGE